MPRGFVVAEADGQSIPRTVEKDAYPSDSYAPGSLVYVNASGQYQECGADPASIAAVTETGVGTDTSGFNIFNSLSFPPGRIQGSGVAGRKRFRAYYVGALPAADGGSYGVVKDSDGFWKVDFTETTALRVKLVGRLTNSPDNQPEVLVEFLDTVAQAI